MPRRDLSRAQYLHEFFQPQKGRDVAKQVEQRQADLKKALELSPDDADALLMAAIAAIQQQKIEEARQYLEHASKLHPDDERIIQQLIGLDAQEQNYERIADRLQHGPKSLRLQQIDFEVKLAKPDLEGARKVLADVEKDKQAPSAIVEFMHAMLDFKEGKWLPASKKLESLRPAFPDRASQIDMMLGHCYEILGEYDRELEAYERAVGDNATSLPAHVGLARALMIGGQSDRALAELELVKRGVGVDEFVKNTLARNALVVPAHDAQPQAAGGGARIGTKSTSSWRPRPRRSILAPRSCCSCSRRSVSKREIAAPRARCSRRRPRRIPAIKPRGCRW